MQAGKMYPAALVSQSTDLLLDPDTIAAFETDRQIGQYQNPGAKALCNLGCRQRFSRHRFRCLLAKLIKKFANYFLIESLPREALAETGFHQVRFRSSPS